MRRMHRPQLTGVKVQGPGVALWVELQVKAAQQARQAQHALLLCKPARVGQQGPGGSRDGLWRRGLRLQSAFSREAWKAGWAVRASSAPALQVPSWHTGNTK